MKSKQTLLNVLAAVITFEYIGVTAACAMHPSWGALVMNIACAVVCVVTVHSAHFYKYRTR
jgi:ammonia channel protein AmtB